MVCDMQKFDGFAIGLSDAGYGAAWSALCVYLDVDIVLVGKCLQGQIVAVVIFLGHV